jgi:hypothetical protein
MTEKTKNHDGRKIQLHPIAIIGLILMTICGTLILWVYFSVFQDAQAMQAILNEQCPEKNIVVDLDFYNDYDPYLNWGNGEAYCEQWRDEPITCTC